MRAQWFVGAGVGVFILGLVAVGCSDAGESPFDAGTLSDDGAAGPDTSTGEDSASPDSNAGDDGAPQSDDASSRGDQDAPATPDSPSGSDANDASVPEDANDGAPEEDANDAASAPDASDASSPLDASDAAVADASDAAVADASDAAPISDASQPDASALCDGYDAGTNPILAVVATDDGQTVGQPSSGSASASAADPVVFVATTSPAGLAQIVQIGFCTGVDTKCASTTPTYITMTLDADAGAADDVWTGQIPAKTAGTTVNWFIQAQDVCGTGPTHWHYWSNFGDNFSYTTN